MPKIRYLHIVFSEDIQSYDIPKFRAAVIEKTNRESDLFHNHMDNSINIYRYPLIQYKVTDRKASLVCLKEATEDIHYLLKQKKFDFRIGQEQLLYEIDDVRLKYERIQTWDTDFQYNMLNWIALNQDNYELYKSKTSLWEKIKLLEEILEKHIRIFMESMNAEEIVPLKVRILDIKSEKHIRYKDIFHLTFCINFSCNLSIPNYVGLGKGVSVGFGNVKKINEINFNPKK
ncbi:MAG TPA: CRISPR-associated endonuclease Cas6 [Saprospiraceae bacterium]|nr:CRISPR-associated endonuclease Cas6 [Saprospiraceae bacterium]